MILKTRPTERRPGQDGGIDTSGLRRFDVRTRQHGAGSVPGAIGFNNHACILTDRTGNN
jgi:hypothetical protein